MTQEAPWTTRRATAGAGRRYLFALGSAVHIVDHLRRGQGSVTEELYWAGNLALVVQVAVITLVLTRPPVGPARGRGRRLPAGARLLRRPLAAGVERAERPGVGDRLGGSPTSPPPSRSPAPWPSAWQAPRWCAHEDWPPSADRHRRSPRAPAERVPFAIRAEQPGDEAAIAAVVEAAFGSPAEARLVDLIRAVVRLLAGAVARGRGRRPAGRPRHDQRGDVGGGRRSRAIATLSPLAVAPDRQRQGIGPRSSGRSRDGPTSGASRWSCSRARPTTTAGSASSPPTRSASTSTLPDWAPPEAAQVLRLRAYDPSVQGRVVYPPAFDEVARDRRPVRSRRWRRADR